MRSLFEYKRPHQALLAPLGSRRRFPHNLGWTAGGLPPVVAPVAVTVAGGLALVLVLGAFLSRQASVEPPQVVARAEQPAAPQAEPAPVQAEPPAAAAQAAPATPAAAAGPALAPVAAAAARPLGPSRPDPGLTASIPRIMLDADASGSPVPVAESEEELLALEAIQMQEVETDLSQPSPEATAAIDPASDVPMRTAVTTKYVNMRAGPGDDAEVLLVVPARAEIEAEADCGWCAVSYDGRSGFIYKSFISYRD